MTRTRLLLRRCLKLAAAVCLTIPAVFARAGEPTQISVVSGKDRSACPSIIGPAPSTPMMPGTGDSGADNFPSLAAAGGGAAGGATGDYGGYLDSAIPRSQIRLRADAAYDNNRPDRAEFFYSKCGCNPGAPGPFGLERRIKSYQDISAVLEYAPQERFSVFAEVPVRFLNPDVNNNEFGLSNINAGFKFAAIADECRYLTFQLRGYFPIGNSHEGLGYKHNAIEPSVLYYQQLSEKVFLQAEFRDWIPWAGTDYQGSVLRYGLGLGWRALETCRYWAGPVAEVVGWTVLNGKELAVPGDNNVPAQVAEHDATGDTIVNGKLGVRFGVGDQSGSGILNQSDIFIGYARALTGEVWYKDSARVELRLRY